jgi:hypothetical protein
MPPEVRSGSLAGTLIAGNGAARGVAYAFSRPRQRPGFRSDFPTGFGSSPFPLSSVLLAHSATLVQARAASVIVHWALGASTPVTTHVDAVWL